jgi:type IV fimbrial biogenesis protein FimT
MIVIAIAGIMISYALPNFTELMKNNRIVTKTNDLVTGLSTARQFAISRALTVFVCHSNNANSATPSCGGSGSSWNSGYLIYAVKPKTVAPTSLAAYSSSSHDLLRKEALKSDDNISVTSTVASNYMGFSSTGLLAISAAIDMDICDDRTAEKGRRIAISTAGRINAQEFQCT